ICTSNRLAPLKRALLALREIEADTLASEEIAVIVVDNRPNGDARALCEALRPTLPMPFVFAEEPRAGISFARNRAVSEALSLAADFIAFLDDDDVPQSDWLGCLVRRQRETGADLVFGFWALPSNLSLPPWLRDTRYFRPPRVDDTNRFGLPGWAGTHN